MTNGNQLLYKLFGSILGIIILGGGYLSKKIIDSSERLGRLEERVAGQTQWEENLKEWMTLTTAELKEMSEELTRLEVQLEQKRIN